MGSFSARLTYSLAEHIVYFVTGRCRSTLFGCGIYRGSTIAMKYWLSTNGLASKISVSTKEIMRNMLERARGEEGKRGREGKGREEERRKLWYAFRSPAAETSTFIVFSYVNEATVGVNFQLASTLSLR